MTVPQAINANLSDAGDVLAIFCIPFGGGIPAGVLLAQAKRLPWPVTLVLYAISDVILAVVFETILILIRRLSEHSPRLSRFSIAFRLGFDRWLTRFKTHLGPMALIGISFGIDPMTGRTVALLAGHGRVMSWTLAIIGDLIFFGLLMASTLWLNGILGDGNLTTLIILAVMLGGPPLFRKLVPARRRAPSD